MLDKLPNSINLEILSYLRDTSSISRVSKKFLKLFYQDKLSKEFGILSHVEDPQELYLTIMKNFKNIEGVRSVIRYLMVKDMHGSKNRDDYDNALSTVEGENAIEEILRKENEENSIPKNVAQQIFDDRFDLDLAIKESSLAIVDAYYDKAKGTVLYKKSREDRYVGIIKRLCAPVPYNFSLIKKHLIGLEPDASYINEDLKEGCSASQMEAMAFFEIMDTIFATNAIQLLETILVRQPGLINFEFSPEFKHSLIGKAIFHKKPEIVNVMLSAKANVNQTTSYRLDGQDVDIKPIDFAIIWLQFSEDNEKRGMEKIIQSLLKSGAILPTWDKLKSLHPEADGVVEAYQRAKLIEQEIKISDLASSLKNFEM